MVAGSKADAEALREEVAAVRAPMGLRLAAARTRTCHIDEGFDFLGLASRGTQSEARPSAMS
jgi:RNA-directed DNA polymerase